MTQHLLILFSVMLFSGALTAEEGPLLRLSMKRAVELALAPEGSTRIQLAGELIRESQSRSAQARSALLPDIESSITQENLNRNLAAFGVKFNIPLPGFTFPRVVGPFNVFDVRATATQPVFDISSIRRYQASRVAVSAAKADSGNTQDQVASLVAKAYLAALKAQADLETGRANVELAQALLKQAENLKAAGTGTGIEVTRARVQLANEKQRLLVAENDRRRARLQLLRAMNLRLDTELELTDQLVYNPVDAAAIEQAKAEALQLRPDLVAQQRKEENARLAASATRLERLPSLAAFADYGSIGSSINNALPTRTFGVSLKVPVFDGGRRDARRAESDSQFRQERLRTRDLRDQIALDVQLAIDALASADDEVKVAREGLELAENELAQARRRVQAGVAVSLESTDAQTRLERARDNQVTALFHHEQARIDFGQATGTLLRMIR